MIEILDELLNYGSIAIKKHSDKYTVVRLDYDKIDIEFICSRDTLEKALHDALQILKISDENPKLYLEFKINTELHIMKLEGESE